jgi:hypothetical protein
MVKSNRIKSFKSFISEWVEYNFKYGENIPGVRKLLKKLRKRFNLPEKMPGDI